MYHQTNLWENQSDSSNLSIKNQLHKTVIIDTDGEVILYKKFFNLETSKHLFSELYTKINWRQENIKIYGKKISLPRLTAWYGDEGKSYTYSGIEQHPEPWLPVLEIIKLKVEEVAEVTFNSVLLNLYRHGQDSVAWHSDDEPELGENPIIASLSFGATRRFSLKHKYESDYYYNIDLTPGSLLLMQGETQHYWLHQVPKTKRNVTPRINLTFRVIKTINW
jgi:alkylated DNA repair dioxygenase AlkB